MSAPEIVITVQEVSKAYRIWRDPSHRLRYFFWSKLAYLASGRLGKYFEKRALDTHVIFHALRDVSFQVKKGEAVGIIGRNGAGKSSLLQVIAGILTPTSGFARTSGRIAALLELGSGFNPEFTGRENVYLNGAVLGISRREMDSKFREIADFAEIGEFMDQPVKTYSSGMMMRLAFAVQTAVEPDLIIVDEALSVGDAPFQAKCFARLRRMRKQGCSFLLVSHSPGTIQALCDRALFLDHGKVAAIGDAKSVCDQYQIACMKAQGIVAHDADTTGTKEDGAPTYPTDRLYKRRNLDFDRHAARQRAGSSRIVFIDCYLADAEGNPTTTLEFDEPVQVNWLIEAREDIRASISIALTVKTLKGTEIMSSTDKNSIHILDLKSEQRVLVSMPISFPLRADRYYFTSSLFQFPEDDKFLNGVINFDKSNLLDLVEYCYFFEVVWDRQWAHYGPVQQDSIITVTTIN